MWGAVGAQKGILTGSRRLRARAARKGTSELDLKVGEELGSGRGGCVAGQRPRAQGSVAPLRGSRKLPASPVPECGNHEAGCAGSMIM